MKNLLSLLVLFLTVQVALAQRTVKGTVTDASGQGLIGATIQAVGSDAGVATDLDGNYSIDVPEGVTVLRFSYTGYSEQDVTLGASNVVNVELQEGAILDEVVVTGYSVEKKRDLIGAVAVMDLDAIQSVSQQNVLQTMQGRVAGVNVDLSGNPGQGARVRIRGESTIGKTNDPLYIVDGVPFLPSELNDNNSDQPTIWGLGWLNPNDIESVQVLKDASSASIYGARASNGVVIITTKNPEKDSEGKLRLNVSNSWESWNLKDHLTNNEERATIEWQGAVNDGTDPDATGIWTYDWNYDTGLGAGVQGNGVPVLNNINYPDWLDEGDQLRPAGFGGSITEGTNWFDEVSQAGNLQRYDLSYSQGNAKSGVYAGGFYNGHNGVVINTDYQRIGGRLNSYFRFLNGKVKVGQNLTASGASALWVDNGFGGTPDQGPYRYKSILPVTTEDGRYSGPPGGGFSDRDNPVALSEDNKDDRYKNIKVFGNVYADVQIWKGLSFRSSYGVDYDNFSSKDIFRTYSRGFLANTTAELTESRTNVTNWVFNNTFTYNMDLGAGNLTLLAGTEAVKNNFDRVVATGKEFALETPDYFVLGAATGEKNTTGVRTGFSLFSYFGKANYSYAGKYLASATIRRDGSSRFGTENQFAVFPAASVGWRISEEDFLKDNNTISNLKVRVGWGQTGNQDILNDARFGLYRAVYAPQSNILPWDGGCAQTPCPDAATSYDIGNQGTGILPSGFVATQTANDALKWETTTEINFGIDFGLLNDRLVGFFDVFQKQTEDLLVQPTQIGAFGDGANQWVNGADMETTGWEAAIEYLSKPVGDWRWSVGTVLSHYDAKITALPEDLWSTYPGNEEQNIIGQAPNAIFGYRTDGIFQNQTEVDAHAEQVGKRVGALRFVDLNNDGTVNALDQEYLGRGNGVADLEFGLNARVEYKAFDFSISTWGALGRSVTPDVFRMELGSLDNGENGGVNQLDAWSFTNTGSYIPAVSNSNRPFGFSLDYNVRNGNFLSFRQATIGYTLPSTSGLGDIFSRLRIYLTGENLGWIVDKSGSNQFPHQATWRVENTVSGIYPKSMRMTIGANVEF